MTGRPGKWPWKNHSVAVTPLIPTIRFASASYSTIRSTSRNGQRCGIRRLDLAGRMDRCSVTGGSGAVRALSLAASGAPQRRTVVCRYAPSHAHARAAAARKAALPTRSRRFVVIRPSRNVSLREHRLVDGDVGRQALDDELVEGDAAAGDGGRPVRAPHDELAEERVVERRDLVAAVQVRVHPDARAAGGVVALDEAGAGPEVVGRVLGVDPELDGVAAERRRPPG